MFMLSKIFSSDPVSPQKGLAVVRIITGLLMAYHGWEVFDRELMEGYMKWDVIKKMPAPEFMVYLGKGLELVTGILLTIGLCTRIASLFMIVDMLFICFFIGNGKFYYQDQHPFLFALLALTFLFTGPGSWSLQYGRSKSK
jgi:putative oxidoreductase